MLLGSELGVVGLSMYWINVNIFCKRWLNQCWNLKKKINHYTDFSPNRNSHWQKNKTPVQGCLISYNGMYNNSDLSRIRWNLDDITSQNQHWIFSKNCSLLIITEFIYFRLWVLILCLIHQVDPRNFLMVRYCIDVFFQYYWFNLDHLLFYIVVNF